MMSNLKKQFREQQWKLYQKKVKALLPYGFQTRKVQPYDEELIEKLRTVYEGSSCFRSFIVAWYVKWALL